MNHLSFPVPSKRLTLTLASIVVSAIAVGVVTDAGGVPSTPNGGPYYPGPNPYYPNPYCADNQPPIADFEYSPVAPKPGDDVTFTSTATDPDGDPLDTGWDFDGDWDPTHSGPYSDPFAGIDQVGADAKYSYDAPGDYRVRMGVLDSCQAFDITDRIVHVEKPPDATPAEAPPPPSTPPPPSPMAPAEDTSGPKIVISRAINGTRRVSSTGVFTFVLGPFAEDVTGTISFVSVRAVLRNRRLRLRRKAISAAKGKRLTVRARLSKAGLRALRRRKRIRMRADVVLRDVHGNASKRDFVFTLTAPKTQP